MATIRCDFCLDDKRTQHYEKHMSTHIRGILRENPVKLSEYIREKQVVVVHSTKRVPTSEPDDIVHKFAQCLVCGLTAKAYKFHSPPLRDYKKKNQSNAVTDFAQFHNMACGEKYNTIADWYDLTKPQPRNNFVRIKKPGSRGGKTTVAKPAPTAQAIPAVYDDRTLRDYIAKKAPDIFDYYYYESDDDEGNDDEDEVAEHKAECIRQRNLTVLEMYNKTLDSRQYFINQLKKKDATAKALLDKKREMYEKEIQKMEAEIIRLRSEIDLTKSNTYRHLSPPSETTDS